MDNPLSLVHTDRIVELAEEAIPLRGLDAWSVEEKADEQAERGGMNSIDVGPVHGEYRSTSATD